MRRASKANIGKVPEDHRRIANNAILALRPGGVRNEPATGLEAVAAAIRDLCAAIYKACRMIIWLQVIVLAIVVKVGWGYISQSM
jgi:hypothetical protein